MRTSPAWQRVLAGLTTMVVLGGVGAWLGLSYLGVVSRDVRVTAEVAALGDALGPGAKVRFDGLIVGRVQNVEPGAERPVVTLLVDADHADVIPAGSTARVLPSTVFGSEYVELVPPSGDVAAAGTLTDGAVLAADTSEDTLGLMVALEEAQQLLRAVDVEGISRATGTLAAALDGNGSEVGAFIERADQLVTTVNDDAELWYATLADATAAAKVLTAVLPDATDAAENARTTASLLVERTDDIGTLVTATTDLAGTADAAVVRHTPAIVDLLATTAVPLGILADHPRELQAILSGAPGVLHNGATSIDGQSIQMNGLIGLDPLDPYTALDCPQYGPVRGGSCGGPVPASMLPQEPAEPGTVRDVQELLDRLQGGEPATTVEPGEPTPAPGTAGPSSPAAPAAPATGPTPLQLLLALVGGGR